jgi:hypothetical protein
VANSFAARRAHLRQLTAAAALALPAAIVSHRSAAVLAELPLLTLPDRPCVTVPPRMTGDAVAAHLHRAQLPAEQIRVAAIPRTSPARAALDTARESGVLEGLVIADAALHLGMTTPTELRMVLDGCRGWPGARFAADVTAFADGLAESPLETVSRWSMRRAGIPAPMLQPEIFDEYGGWLGRGDFYWDEFGVLGEADGRQKLSGADPAPLYELKQRQDLFEDCRLIVVRWGWRDALEPARLGRRLLGAFERGRRMRALGRAYTVQPTQLPAAE